METPILFIVFNRLDTTKRVFEQIRQVKPKKLYIASDGPRDDKEREKVNNVRKFLIENIDWNCNLKTRFRDKNLGVGFGVNDAISWFFSEEESGIILEHDCLPSLSFFRFCSELLDKYRENKKIAVIQGFNPFPNENYPYSYFFSKYDLKWGWATWRDRWEYQDMYTSDWPLVKNSSFLDNISSDNKLVRLYWEGVFNMIHRSPNITWDTQFTYQILKKKLLTIVPKKNLILNIGFGPDATYTKWGIPEHIKNLKLEEIEFPLIHPKELNLNIEYDKLVESIHFEINPATVLRFKLRNFLESNVLTNKIILPSVVSIYRLYKKIKLKIYE